MAPELKFEDLDAHEQRVAIDDPTSADRLVSDSPSRPAAVDVPSPAAIEKCSDGQELPGMEVDDTASGHRRPYMRG